MKDEKSYEYPEIQELYRATAKDFKKISSVLGRAFSDDPVWGDILKNKPEKFSIVFNLPVKHALRYGVIYAPTSNLEGIAVWLGPYSAEFKLWHYIRSGAMFSGLKLGFKISMRIFKDLGQLDKDRKENMKSPYFYLNVLGVDESFKGQGIGTKLVSKFIENAPLGIPFYLETETERNVKFYERLGFKVIKKYIIPSNNLPMWEMKHEGRKK